MFLVKTPEHRGERKCMHTLRSVKNPHRENSCYHNLTAVGNQIHIFNSCLWNIITKSHRHIVLFLRFLCISSDNFLQHLNMEAAFLSIQKNPLDCYDTTSLKSSIFTWHNTLHRKVRLAVQKEDNVVLELNNFWNSNWFFSIQWWHKLENTNHVCRASPLLRKERNYIKEKPSVFSAGWRGKKKPFQTIKQCWFSFHNWKCALLRLSSITIHHQFNVRISILLSYRKQQPSPLSN